MRRLAVLVSVLSVLAPGLSTRAQEPSQTSDVTLGTVEVKLDVVARNRHGRAVTTLSESDLTILEDGQPQTITSFRLVRPSPVPGTAEASPSTVTQPYDGGQRSLTTPVEDVRAVAMVFDSLSPEGRALAYKGAKAYVENTLQPGDVVGIFVADNTLVSIQPYTMDREAILRGIELAGGRAGSSLATQRRASTLRGTINSAPSTDVEATFNGPGGGGGGRDEAILSRMRNQTRQGFENLQNVEQAYSATNALIAVTEGLSLLPGRKSLLFFSEGIVPPPQVRARFKTVIANANQARVSIYTINPSGLHVTSPLAPVTASVNGLGAQRMNELGTPGEGSGESMLRRFENNEDQLLYGGNAGLERLAKETGGYFVGETNSIVGKLRQIDEDMRTFYSVTYAPTNGNYDGSFRHVSVAVNRRGVDVRTREGYFAINVTNAPPVLPYEAPAVAAAVSKKTRSDFAIRSLAASFPERERPGLSPIIVSVPASAATFLENSKKKSFATAFTIVVLARDRSGQIVAKTSREYVLTGPLEKLAAMKNSDLLYYAELDLDPGRYVIDVAAYDAPSQKVSVQRLPLVVHAPDDDGPRLSSLTIVDRAEPAQAVGDSGGEPFLVGSALLYPNLGAPLKKLPDSKLAFFVTAYLPAGETTIPDGVVEIAQGGQSLKSLPIELPAPDPQGRIQYTNAFPIDAFPAGTYELRVTISDGVHSASRSARFTIST